MLPFMENGLSGEEALNVGEIKTRQSEKRLQFSNAITEQILHLSKFRSTVSGWASLSHSSMAITSRASSTRMPGREKMPWQES